MRKYLLLWALLCISHTSSAHAARTSALAISNHARECLLNSPSATDDIQATTRALYNPNGLLCTSLDELDVGLPLTNSPLCSIYTGIWPNGQPRWLETLRARPDTLDKNSAEYVNPTRQEMLARGYTYANQDTQIRMAQQFQNIVGGMIQDCCGQDYRCAEALGRIQLEFCEDPNALTPTDPDACAGSGSGVYNQSRDVILNVSYTLNPSFRREVRASPAALARINPGQVAVGRILIGRYLRPGSSSFNLPTIHHEMGHACQAVKTQLYALDNSSDMFAGLVGGRTREESCSASNTTIYNLFRNVRPDEQIQQTVSDCVVDGIISENSNTQDLGYSPTNCPRAKAKEAWADVFKALTMADKSRSIHNLCHQVTDPQHFSGYKTAECLLSNDPQYRNEVRAELQCP